MLSMEESVYNIHFILNLFVILCHVYAVLIKMSNLVTGTKCNEHVSG